MRRPHTIKPGFWRFLIRSLNERHVGTVPTTFRTVWMVFWEGMLNHNELGILNFC